MQNELNLIKEKTENLYNPPAKLYVVEKHLKKPWFYIVHTKSVLKLCKNYYIFKKVDEIAQN